MEIKELRPLNEQLAAAVFKVLIDNNANVTKKIAKEVKNSVVRIVKMTSKAERRFDKIRMQPIEEEIADSIPPIIMA